MNAIAIAALPIVERPFRLFLLRERLYVKRFYVIAGFYRVEIREKLRE